jgi:hypothetical protein
MTLVESQPLLRCAAAAYPPTEASCATLLATGVRDDRTIEQSEDGHVVTITDRFLSTDGQPHQLDLMPQNDQYFAKSGLGGVHHGDEIAYRFPGEASYRHREAGEVVAFESATPGAIYVEVEGAPDGDTSTGRGAIVFDRPASPATFTGGEPLEDSFHLRQTAAVPAGGAATVRFAYVQAFTAAEVERLAGRAEEAFRTPVPPAPPVLAPHGSPTSRAAPAPPSNSFRFGRRRLDRARGTAHLSVVVPGAGTLLLSGPGLKRVEQTVAAAATVSLPVVPRRATARRLAKRHRLELRCWVTFTPSGGSPSTRRLSLDLLRRSRR